MTVNTQLIHTKMVPGFIRQLHTESVSREFSFFCLCHKIRDLDTAYEKDELQSQEDDNLWATILTRVVSC